MLATDLLASRLPPSLAAMFGSHDAPVEARPRGRSRYSKALPSVPVVGLGRCDSSSSRPLPPVPNAGPNPAPNPATGHGKGKGKGTPTIISIARKPVGSSIPIPSSAGMTSKLLPTSWSAGSSAGSSTPSSTASVMIPRRPVGAPLHPPALPTLIAPPEPSPTDSICSLLSAYAREPDDSLSSGNTYTTVSSSNRIPDSGNSSSAATDAFPAGRGQTVQTQSASAMTSSHRHISGPGDGCPPAPPPKGDLDKLNSQPKPLPEAPEPDQTASSSSPLWKRRPPTAGKNKELPDLKLNVSYRSTASISSIRTAVIRTSSDTITGSIVGPEDPGGQHTPPRPPVKGLPGRDIRVAGKGKPPDQPPCLARSVGSVASRVNRLKHKWATSAKVSEKLNGIPPAARSDSMRPPTPEYRKGDADPPSTPSVNDAKPASPVSVSGSSREGAAQATRPTDLSQVPAPQPFLPSALPLERDAKPANSLHVADLNSIPRRKQLSAAPELRLAPSTSPADLGQKRSSPPYDKASAATRWPVPAPTARGRNRGPSKSPDSASNHFYVSGRDSVGVVPASTRRPGVASGGHDPRIVYSDTQEAMYRGRHGTLYAEMKVLETPDPKASYFPKQTDEPLEPGTVIASRPLNRSHFDCFHKHKTMNRRSNRNYSLTCQTCDKADTEDRWVCTFCHLRICDGCLRAFNGHQRVLQSLVDQLGMSTRLSSSSLPRSESATGVEAELAV
ncbi:hypothetical protein E4U42_001321 [Claviceps africana]|uniref:Uncharacterized protein n=1 Tax=Claviceps africana TaxID=83212 RepID=A0A8K0NF71_9HYPO|nr:hypothetical protein E4U42_001321 [Claviceps africana]